MMGGKVASQDRWVRGKKGPRRSSDPSIDRGGGGGSSAVVPAKDFKRRMVVEIDGAPHMIEQIQVQTPSARGAATLYKVKARNLKPRARIERAFRGTDGLNESSFERRPVQFLYRDADGFHFMDAADFSQFSYSAEDLRDLASFMTEN